MKVILFVLSTLTLNAYATVKPMTVKDILVGMDTCLNAQAQAVTSEVQTGLDKVSITLSAGSISASVPDATADLEFNVDPNTSMFVPQLSFNGAWAQGGCTGSYAEIGYNSDGSFGFSKTSYCPSSTHDDTNPLQLQAPAGSVPAVTYTNANRTPTFNNLGERTPLMDVVSGLTMVPSTNGTPSNVVMVNTRTQHSTSVTFNSTAYQSCLQKAFGF